MPSRPPPGGYSFEQLYQLAEIAHASGVFTDINDAAQAMMKILRGQELGLPPMTSLSAFDLIQKRLFLKPWAIAAKINSCGYGGFRVVTHTAEECTIVFLRKYPDMGWQECPPVRYTIAEAAAHGLTGRSPHWKASPAHMLYQRALGRGGWMYFPELLAGLELAMELEPVSSAQHAQNVVDVYGDQAEVQAHLTAARSGTPVPPIDLATGEVLTPDDIPEPVLLTDEPAPPGRRGGQLYITQINQLHMAHEMPSHKLAEWWEKVCRERSTATAPIVEPQQLPLDDLVKLHKTIRDYYDKKGSGGTATPLPTGSATQSPASEE
jgi:hypothetical protein